MKKNIDLFLLLMKSSIYDTASEQLNNKQIDWEKVYHFSQKNIAVPLLYKTVLKLSDQYPKDEAVFDKWKKNSMIYLLREMEKRNALKKLLEEASKRNITFVVFKGVVLSDLYPNPYTRIVSDSDLFVFEKDKKNAILLLEEFGYVKDEKSSKNEVPVFELHEKSHVIELHFCLWEDHKGAKMDLLDQMNLLDLNTLIKIPIANMEVTTLGYEQHLVYQMFHIIKHFSLQGIGMRYLTDITLYINKYGHKIDFRDFWNKMNLLSYTKFCEYFFTICIDYLDMDPIVFQSKNVEIGPNIEGFLIDLFNVGITYEDKDAAWQIMGIMAPYFTGVSKVPKTKFGREIKILMPSSKMLPKQYAYAKKFPILLPIAWIHKDFNYLLKWKKNRKNWLDASEKMEVAENRLYLLRSLGLMDE